MVRKWVIIGGLPIDLNALSTLKTEVRSSYRFQIMINDRFFT